MLRVTDKKMKPRLRHTIFPILLIFLSACDPANHMNPANPSTNEYWLAQILSRIHPPIFRENTGSLEWTLLVGKSSSLVNAKGVVLDPFLNPVLFGDTNTALFNGTLFGTQDMFIAKYDPQKNQIWAKQLGAPGASLTAVKAASDSIGNTYVLGFTSAAFTGPMSSGQDMFVVKFALDGTVVWAKQAGPTGGSYFVNPIAICLDEVGNSYSVGDSNGPFGGPVATGGNGFVLRFDVDGNQSWVKQYSISGANITSGGCVWDKFSGTVLVSGWGGADFRNDTAPGVGGNDTFVMRYDPDGTRHFLIYEAETAREILSGPMLLDSFGDIYVTATSNASFGSGSSGTAYPSTILKYNSGGTRLWVRQDGDGYPTGQTSSLGIVSDIVGNVFIAGYTNTNLTTNNSASVGTTDVFFIKYNRQGERQWLRQIGASGKAIQGTGIAIDREGTMYGTGTTNADFNGIPLTGTQDSFLVQYR
ncbi:hypothetical protein EFP84_08675 [Leptospira kmetyi]|uniref:Beta-propeller repeat protein n=2 Tax=Leptospira kmetyi TaxID=408139 RepID=A0AAD0UMG3_9LEPT|nr:hypothetical protein EFP84_08675 [Leptospira kmetyi]TGL66775.1 hypothetical protein EHQ67_15665 [Leptospira kmetyi]